MPWLTIQANDILQSLLLPDDIGVELGSGRSTLWLAKRVGELISIEHNREWFSTVQKRLKEAGVENVEYTLHTEEEVNENGVPVYYACLEHVRDLSLDFCLIDGLYRDECAEILVRKLKPGGVMVIDNVNRYLPWKTHSPASVGPDGPPASEKWMSVSDTLGSWRKIWTSTGVTDTAFFFKSCADV